MPDFLEGGWVRTDSIKMCEIPSEDLILESFSSTTLEFSCRYFVFILLFDSNMLVVKYKSLSFEEEHIPHDSAPAEGNLYM